MTGRFFCRSINSFHCAGHIDINYKLSYNSCRSASTKPMRKRVNRMICPKCGANCPDGYKFCANCGAPFSAPQQEQPNQAQQDFNRQNGYQQNNYQQNGYQQNNGWQNGYQQNGYQQNNYQPGGFPQGGHYRVQIQARDIAISIILSLVTCGIYGIYWLIRLADDLNIASGRTNDPSGGMVALLTFVTCGIYGIYWAYKAGEKVAYIKNRNTGEVDTSCATLYLIISLVGGSIVVWALIQSELNKVATLQ